MNVSLLSDHTVAPQELMPRLQMHCNLLDRAFHTPSLVCSRSPFLLTTSKSPLNVDIHAIN